MEGFSLEGRLKSVLEGFISVFALNGTHKAIIAFECVGDFLFPFLFCAEMCVNIVTFYLQYH